MFRITGSASLLSAGGGLWSFVLLFLLFLSCGVWCCCCCVFVCVTCLVLFLSCDCVMLFLSCVYVCDVVCVCDMLLLLQEAHQGRGCVGGQGRRGELLSTASYCEK